MYISMGCPPIMCQSIMSACGLVGSGSGCLSFLDLSLPFTASHCLSLTVPLSVSQPSSSRLWSSRPHSQPPSPSEIRTSAAAACHCHRQRLPDTINLRRFSTCLLLDLPSVLLGWRVGRACAATAE